MKTRMVLSIIELIVGIYCLCLSSYLVKSSSGQKTISALSYIVRWPLRFALIASSLCAAAHFCAVVHASPDYVSSCVSERAVELTASAASFMSVCHPVPGLQWPVAVNSVSLSVMAQAVLRTHCRDRWHVEGCGWGRGVGVPAWGRERKLWMPRRAERDSNINVPHYLSLSGSSRFTSLPLWAGQRELSASLSLCALPEDT